MPDDTRRLYSITQYKVYKMTYHVTAANAGEAVTKLLTNTAGNPDIVQCDGSLKFVENDETRGEDFDDFMTDMERDIVAEDIRFDDFIPSICNVTDITPPATA